MSHVCCIRSRAVVISSLRGAGTLELQTSPILQDALIPPHGELQRLRNMVKRGDRMGTSDSRSV